MKCTYSALLTDFYELTMMQGFHNQNFNRRTVFDMFFRRQPFGGGYAVCAGIEPMLEAVQNFQFSPEDMAYLEGLKCFSESFLNYLRDFRFTGDIYAVKEGSVVFPNEPIVRVSGTLLETQLIEPLLLNLVNFQTLIATKAARVCWSAKGAAVMEFGLRRAQGTDGAISASRASYIGGVKVTSNVLAGKLYDIPVNGTMAHSWVMSFANELDAFEAFADIYPDNCILLADTYDTIHSGVPNAIIVMKKLKEKGHKNYGIRLDSGDLCFLSREARKIFDANGLPEAKIVASNDLDEWVIDQMNHEGACINAYGVGTRLVTADKDSSLTGVYKLAAKEEKDGSFTPTMKMTNNPEKMSNPGIKNIYRFYDYDDSMMGDLVFLEDNARKLEELIAENKSIRLNHPSIEYAYKTLSGYAHAELLLENVMKDGKVTKESRSVKEIRDYAKSQISALHDTYKRLLNPHIYKVSISNELKELKSALINKMTP
jgi:nicotinate phosphoribosyltransferase